MFNALSELWMAKAYSLLNDDLKFQIEKMIVNLGKKHNHRWYKGKIIYNSSVKEYDNYKKLEDKLFNVSHYLLLKSRPKIHKEHQHIESNTAKGHFFVRCKDCFYNFDQLKLSASIGANLIAGKLKIEDRINNV